MNTLEILVEVQKRLDDAQEFGGLSVKTMLGYPNLGRPEVVPPLAAITFAADAPKPVPALGRLPAHIDQIQATVYLVALNEQGLLALVDAMRNARPVLTSVVASGVIYILRWGPTRRVTLSEDERDIGFAVATDLTVQRP